MPLGADAQAERGIGLARRLGVIVYDSLLLFAVLSLAAALALLAKGGEPPWESSLRPLYQAYLLLVAYLYFGWFWTRGGQTLGMKAWRCRIVGAAGGPVGWRESAARFLLALVSWAALGLGFAWSAPDRRRLAWHDIGSRTFLRLEPKASRRSA
jgi:uncharacterized RDD family membrane protein YckC